MQVERTDTLVPLTLAVSSQSGPETGLATVVAVRDTLNGDYLDFSDLTFKASPTIKKTPLVELGNGFYNKDLDLTSITNLPTGTRHLGLEFEITTSGKQSVTSEILTLRASLYDIPAALLAKIVDGAVTVQTLFARTNAYIRGKILLDTVSAAPDTDVEYYAENNTTKLFENRKAPTDRTPQ